MIETLVYLTVLLIGAFMAACIVELYSFCIGEPDDQHVIDGRIFSVFGRFVQRQYLAHEKRSKGKGLNWWKAIGLCKYCVTVWIAWITLAVGHYLDIFQLITHADILELVAQIIVYPSVSLYLLLKWK